MNFLEPLKSHIAYYLFCHGFEVDTISVNLEELSIENRVFQLTFNFKLKESPLDNKNNRHEKPKSRATGKDKVLTLKRRVRT